MKSLHATGHSLSNPSTQLGILSELGQASFQETLALNGLHPLKPTGIDIFQVNVGYMCNQTCKHCHVDAGPDRKEIMTRETMQACLDALAASDIHTVDLTGGAPEMNPHFRWFVEEIVKQGRHVMVRCNLTILTVNPTYRELPQFYADHGVEVVSSLPYYQAAQTDRQRGDGVFDASIEALQMLNAVGYGKPGSGLRLNLVYNPFGAFLPASQERLEADFKKALFAKHGIEFNSLFVITNMPISRYLDFLIVSDNLETYMTKLVNAFNPSAAMGVMCRNTISIGWDGYLYDCDFNQMLGMNLDSGAPQHVKDFDVAALSARDIRFDQHCFGCTAGSGSSCGGAVV